jgi:hypothetical protein
MSRGDALRHNLRLRQAMLDGRDAAAVAAALGADGQVCCLQ